VCRVYSDIFFSLSQSLVIISRLAPKINPFSAFFSDFFIFVAAAPVFPPKIQVFSQINALL